MEISTEVTRTLADVLMKQYNFATTAQLDAAVLEIVNRTAKNQSERRNTFSLSTMIRGLRAIRGEALDSRTAQSDAEYVTKALTTGSTPGKLSGSWPSCRSTCAR